MTNKVQDAVTLAAELHTDPELATAISVTEVELEAAEAAVKRFTGTGRWEDWRTALLERDRVEARLADLRVQCRLRRPA